MGSFAEADHTLRPGDDDRQIRSGYGGLREGRDYQSRRARLVDHLEAAGLAPVVPEGTYFVMARTEAWGELSDRDFCRWLTTEVGVCAIPPSAFMTDPQNGHGLARFAFCKSPETLDQAGALLRQAWTAGKRPPS